MPSPTAVEYPVPQDWQHFERLSRALFSELYGATFQKHGRLGQAQDGVDIFGIHNAQLFAIQCKARSNLASNVLTETDVEQAVRDADCFPNKISRFFVLTTAPDNKVVQQHAISMSQARANQNKFPVEVWGWQTISDHIGNCPGVQRSFYGSWWRRPAVAYILFIAVLCIAVLSLAAIGVRRVNNWFVAIDIMHHQSVTELNAISEAVSQLEQTYSRLSQFVRKVAHAFYVSDSE